MLRLVLVLLQDHVLQGTGSKLDEDGCLTRKIQSAVGRAQLLHSGFWGTELQSLRIIEDKPTTIGGSQAVGVFFRLPIQALKPWSTLAATGTQAVAGRAGTAPSTPFPSDEVVTTPAAYFNLYAFHG